MKESKKFPLRDILSVTTGRLLTKAKGDDNGIGNLYELLEFLCGEAPYTHQLPRFAQEARPYLLRQHQNLEIATPLLTRLDELIAKVGTEKGVEAWVEGMEDMLGKELAVTPILKEAHKRKQTLAELIEMRERGDS